MGLRPRISSTTWKMFICSRQGTTIPHVHARRGERERGHQNTNNVVRVAVVISSVMAGLFERITSRCRPGFQHPDQPDGVDERTRAEPKSGANPQYAPRQRVHQPVEFLRIPTGTDPNVTNVAFVTFLGPNLAFARRTANASPPPATPMRRGWRERTSSLMFQTDPNLTIEAATIAPRSIATRTGTTGALSIAPPGVLHRREIRRPGGGGVCFGGCGHLQFLGQPMPTGT